MLYIIFYYIMTRLNYNKYKTRGCRSLSGSSLIVHAWLMRLVHRCVCASVCVFFAVSVFGCETLTAAGGEVDLRLLTFL